MRDDLKGQFHKLLQYTDRKLEILEILSNNTPKKKHLLNTDKIDQLLDIIAEEEELSGQFNSIDYDIKILENSICEISGIENTFNEFISGRNEPTIVELQKKRALIVNSIRKLTKIQDEFTAELEKKLKALGKDIRTLSLIKKIKNPDF